MNGFVNCPFQAPSIAKLDAADAPSATRNLNTPNKKRAYARRAVEKRQFIEFKGGNRKRLSCNDVLSAQLSRRASRQIGAILQVPIKRTPA